MSAAEWDVPVRGLLLDIDDTLLDTQRAMRRAGTAGAAVAWPSAPATVHEGISAEIYRDPGGWFDAYTRGEVSFEDQRRARYAEALTRLGLPAAGFDSFDSFDPAYREALAREQVLFDDATRLFEAADQAGVPVCLLTNSSASHTGIKLAAVGLTERFAVITTDLFGVGKPDPRPFAAACAAIGVEAAQTLCVGDTLGTDVAGGRAAGLRVAWLQRRELPEPRGADWGTPVDDPGVRIVPDLASVAALL